MVDAEPFEVLENPVDELWPAATGIEILDAQPKLPAAGAGMEMTKRGRIGVAKVKPSRGGRGETCDLQDSLHAKGDIGDS